MVAPLTRAERGLKQRDPATCSTPQNVAPLTRAERGLKLAEDPHGYRTEACRSAHPSGARIETNTAAARPGLSASLRSPERSAD